MILAVNMILGKKCVLLPVTPNDQSLSHIIATYSRPSHSQVYCKQNSRFE